MEQILPPLSSNETAERILAEAWDLFQTKGYRGVSTDELCQRSGITKPTLYYYFRNKETLYIQTMLRQLRGYRALLEQDTPLAERLTTLAGLLLEQYRVSVPAMLRDMEHIHNQSYHQLINQAFEREFFGPIVAAMEQGIADGRLRSGSSSMYAWAYLGLINTFIGAEQKPAASHSQLAADLVDLFFHGAGRD